MQEALCEATEFMKKVVRNTENLVLRLVERSITVAELRVIFDNKARLYEITRILDDEWGCENLYSQSVAAIPQREEEMELFERETKLLRNFVDFSKLLGNGEADCLSKFLSE